MAKPPKPITEYLEKDAFLPVDHLDYQDKPAVAFLKQTIHLCDSINHCRRHFPKKQNGDFTKDSIDSLNYLSCSMVASIMGHFETFQRGLFAGLFEITQYIPNFDIKACIKKLKAETSLAIDVVSLSGYRVVRAATGTILADTLGNWHTPSKFNAYIHTILNQATGFTPEQCRDLAVLWQLRHSIVHAGGTLTYPDAQKVKELQGLGDQAIVVLPQFVEAVARRLHRIVEELMIDLYAKMKLRAGVDFKDDLKDEADELSENRFSPKELAQKQ